jgi:multiple sugar transport system permease protein
MRDRALVPPLGLRLRQSSRPYLFITPKLIFFVAFMLVPLFWTGLMTLQGGGIFGGTEFVGLRNYDTSFHDSLFWLALRNTVLYAALVIPLAIGLAIVLAALLNQRIRFRRTYSLFFIIPAVISPVGASVIWNALLQTEGGPVNSFLGVLGFEPVNWLGTPPVLIPIFVAVEVWRGTGFYAVIFLAAMQSIPRSLYDAAAIDGATGLQSFKLVTLPLIRPAILFSVVIATILNLQLFDSPFVMTRGGPGYSSMTVVMYVFFQAFRYDAMGIAAAMSFLLLMIILSLTVLQLILFRKEVEF